MPTRTNHQPRAVGISTGTWGIPAGIYTGQQQWDVVNEDCRGVHVFVNIPNALVGVTLTVTLRTKDPQSGDYVTLATSAALSGPGTTLLTIYPGILAVGNMVWNQCIGRFFEVVVTPSTNTAATYSVGMMLLV